MGRQPRYVLLHHGVHDLSDPAPVVLVYYVRPIVWLSGTFWLVLSSFFRWQVPSVNLPKLGLDCPPDSTRLLTQICDQIGSTSHVVTMACTNITINVSICARIRPRALTNKSQNCGNSESCDKICIKFWLLFT